MVKAANIGIGDVRCHLCHVVVLDEPADRLYLLQRVGTLWKRLIGRIFPDYFKLLKPNSGSTTSLLSEATDNKHNVKFTQKPSMQTKAYPGWTIDPK